MISIKSKLASVNSSDKRSDIRRDYWRKHLENWRQSGLSQQEYCREHNVGYSTFCRWKKRLGNAVSGCASHLVEVGSFDRDALSDALSVNPFGSPVNKTVNSSAIRFWCGDFCIEIGADFSSETLCHLIRTLRMEQGLAPGRGSVAEGMNFLNK